MERAIELAGFFAAHGIWCVAEGEPLTPMLAQESAAYGRNMLRFAADQLEEGVAQAQEYLDQNLGQAERAALVYDGFVTLPSGLTDALIILALVCPAAHHAHHGGALPQRAITRRLCRAPAQVHGLAGARHGRLPGAGCRVLSRGRVARGGGAGVGAAQ